GSLSDMKSKTLKQKLEEVDQDKCRIIPSLSYGPMGIRSRQKCCKPVKGQFCGKHIEQELLESLVEADT
ncbi:hypothetical protein ACJX0J_025332, partial [Zea mays]